MRASGTTHLRASVLAAHPASGFLESIGNERRPQIAKIARNLPMESKRAVDRFRWVDTSGPSFPFLSTPLALHPLALVGPPSVRGKARIGWSEMAEAPEDRFEVLDRDGRIRHGIDLGNRPLFGYEQGIFRPDIANEPVPQ